MAKLLIVDDDDGIRKMLRQFLVHKGHDVITASSGEEALEKMQEEKMGMVLRAHARDGWESPMVRGCFFSELRGELLTEEHETSIAAYEAWITRKEL